MIPFTSDFIQRFILLIVAMGFVFASSVHGQVTFVDEGDGKFAYTSFLPTSHLHFYLFDDGYHSFSHNPDHQYSTANVPADPKIYHSGPYGTDVPEEFNVGGGYEGDATPYNEPVDLENKVQLKRSWNLVEDKDNFFILMFENNETYTISGCVASPDHEISDYPSEGYTHKFSWRFTDLEPNEQRIIYTDQL